MIIRRPSRGKELPAAGRDHTAAQAQSAAAITEALAENLINALTAGRAFVEA